MNRKITLVMIAAVTCLAQRSALAATAAPAVAPTVTGPTTTTAPMNAAPQALTGVTPPNGSSSGNLNGPTAGSARATTIPGQSTAPGTSNFGTTVGRPNTTTRYDSQTPSSANLPTAGSSPAAATSPSQNSRPNSTITPSVVGAPVPSGRTAGDQGINAYDASVTRQIRERINREDVSIDARNVKIITLNGGVVLRGPVDSNTEQNTIQSIAEDIVGSDRVKNETTIK